MKHNCVIGLSHGYEGDELKTISSIMDDKNCLDLLDSRKSWLLHFNFCPWCGAEIDWEALRKQAMER